jgi:hypothetical protein
MWRNAGHVVPGAAIDAVSHDCLVRLAVLLAAPSQQRGPRRCIRARRPSGLPDPELEQAVTTTSTATTSAARNPGRNIRPLSHARADDRRRAIPRARHSKLIYVEVAGQLHRGSTANARTRGSGARSRARRALRLRSPRDTPLPLPTNVLLLRWDTKPEAHQEDVPTSGTDTEHIFLCRDPSGSPCQNEGSAGPTTLIVLVGGQALRHLTCVRGWLRTALP